MSAILLLIVILAAVNIEASETCNKKLDFLIAVDSSSSICGGVKSCLRWNAILNFTKAIVNSLTIGTYDTRVAYITFSHTTNVEWNLQSYTDKQSLLSAIDNVKYPGGEFTDLFSILKVITEVFNPLKGDRLGVQNIGILISDGAPNYADFIYGAAADLAQAVGVGRFVVCNQPGCTEHYSKAIASPPKKVKETYFLIDDYLKIDQVRDILVKKLCYF